MRSRVVQHVRARLAEVLKLPEARLDSRTALASYGLDSVLVMEANALLGRDFPGLPGTLFFEYGTVEEVAGYLLQEHSGAVTQLFGKQPPHPLPVGPALPASFPRRPVPGRPLPLSHRSRPGAPVTRTSRSSASAGATPRRATWTSSGRT